MNTVFISYSSQDKPFVNRLVKGLRDEGLSVLLDEDFLLPGSDIVTSLSQAISAAHAVLVVLADRAANSEWMLSEVAIALSQKDKLVVPVVATKNADMPFLLRHIQAMDLSDEITFNDNVHRLASFLKQAPAIQEQDSAARIDRIAVESLALQREASAYSRSQTNKNIRLIASATAVVTLTTMVALILIFFKERLGFISDIVTLALGVVAGVGVHSIHGKLKERIAARLTKRTRGEA